MPAFLSFITILTYLDLLVLQTTDRRDCDKSKSRSKNDLSCITSFSLVLDGRLRSNIKAVCQILALPQRSRAHSFDLFFFLRVPGCAVCCYLMLLSNVFFR